MNVTSASNNSQVNMTQTNDDKLIDNLSTKWNLDRNLTVARLNKTLGTNNVKLTLEPPKAPADMDNISNVQQNLPLHIQAMLVMLAALMEDKEIFQQAMLMSQQQVLDTAKTQKDFAYSAAAKTLAGALLAGGMGMFQGAATATTSGVALHKLGKVDLKPDTITEQKSGEFGQGKTEVSQAKLRQADIDIQRAGQISSIGQGGGQMIGGQGLGSIAQGSFASAAEKEKAEGAMRGAEAETLRSSRDLSKASLDSARQMMEQFVNLLAQITKSEAQAKQAIIQNI